MYRVVYVICQLRNVLVPKADLEYIRSVSPNVTVWIIQAIQEKQQRKSEATNSAGKTPPLPLRYIYQRRLLSLKRAKSRDKVDCAS